MNEKQFEFYSDEDLIGVLDTVTGKTFNSFEIVDLLNEQQTTINKLQEELELTAKNKLFSRRKLEEENEQLKKENEKLGNIHLSIDLTYSCGYGRYLADVRVIDDERYYKNSERRVRM